jgi:hypothetical protein
MLGVIDNPKLNVPQRDEWEIKCDLETLIKAREIMLDEERLKSVKAAIEEQKKALNDLTDDEFLKKILGD